MLLWRAVQTTTFYQWLWIATLIAIQLSVSAQCTSITPPAEQMNWLGRLLSGETFGMQRSAELSHSDDDQCTDGEDFFGEPLPPVRTTFKTEGSATILGWPSNGGIWVLSHGGAVELDFLGLSRIETTPSQRYSVEENNFCRRLAYIGAQFYESEYIYVRESVSGLPKDLPTMWYGWPGVVPDDGVWVLRTDSIGGDERIRNATSMEERCRVIEELGGKFYANWDDAPKMEAVEENY